MKTLLPMLHRLAALAAAALLCVAPALAGQAIVDRAMAEAVDMFERARPQLAGAAFGVDIDAYRDALSLGQFQSSHWGGAVSLAVVLRAKAEGSCSRYAAFVRIPPENGQVTLVACPEFVAQGSDALRRLTILHEMVHVVAGPDECRAMAFAARVEHLAGGRHTPVDAYWQANGCAASGFSLP